MDPTSSSDKNDLPERERIRYQYMLNRIQKIQVLIVTIILAMMAYAANAINSANNILTMILFAISCASLVVSLVIAAMDAGAATFYNEKSQDGVSNKTRLIMYVLILLSALFIFAAQFMNAWYNLKPIQQS